MRLLVAWLLFFFTAAAAQATPVGISEQQEAFFHSSLFQRTAIEQVRRIAPWDSVYNHAQRSEVDRWMFAARASGKEVMVSFSYSRMSSKKPPSPARYNQGVSRFLKRYPWIQNYSAWNEPNLGRTRHKPRLVARYYQVLKRRCPTCKIIGAEVVDSKNMARWLRKFKRALRRPPRLWGLHNYNDANRFTTYRTRKMLSLTEGKVWFSETGGIVRKKHRQSFPTGEKHQAKATRFVLDTLAPLSNRIERVYLYHWTQEGRPEAWDSGLVRADGTPRAAYYVVKSRVDEEGKLATDSPTTASPATSPSSGQ